MLEITRELLEHYLRATGWTLDPKGGGWWLGKDWDGNGQRGFPASWLGATTLDIDVVVRITGHSKHLASLAFRLGLCVAAEDNFREARSNFDEGSPRHEVLVSQGDRFLEFAGITHDAWESARKR